MVLFFSDMRTESTTYKAENPKFRTNGALSGFDTIECKPYHAKISQRACAMRYSRAISYDRKRAGRSAKKGILNDIQLHSAHCLKCSEGESNFIRFGKAQQRPKRLASASLQRSVYWALKEGSSCDTPVSEYTDYTIGELRQHIENQFKPGMTWDNYGDWHVDHIIPIMTFSYKTVNDPGFKQCWSLSNLQPLWAEDNQSKHIKIEAPL
jgi:hypothetical protein